MFQDAHLYRKSKREDVNRRKIQLAYNLKCFEHVIHYRSTDVRPDREFYMESPFYACKFGRNNATSHLLAMCNEEGDLVVRDTRHWVEHFVYDFLVHDNAAYDLCWNPSKSEILTASADLSVGCHTLTEGGVVETGRYHFHCRSVLAVTVNQWEPDIVASCGRDSEIYVWDRRTKPYKAAAEIRDSHMSRALRLHPTRDVEFLDSVSLASVGAADGRFKVWDLRKTYRRGKTPTPLINIECAGSSTSTGLSSVILSPHGNIVYVSCVNGSIYAYNRANLSASPVAVFTGHEPKNFHVKSAVSPCGSYLMSGSNDGFAYVWLADEAYRNDAPIKPIVRLPGLSGEVTCLSWSDSPYPQIAMCSDCHAFQRYRLSDLSVLWVCEQDRTVAEIMDISTNKYLGFFRKPPKPVGTSYLMELQEELDNLKDLKPGCSQNADKPTEHPIQKTPQSSKGNILGWLSSSKKTALTPCNRNLNVSPKSPKRNPSRRCLAEQMEGSSQKETPKSPMLLATPAKPLEWGSPSCLQSPTSDLPNFVLDGRSPHNRPEQRVLRKRQADWLTSLANQKRAKQQESSPQPSSSSSKTPRRNGRRRKL